MTEIQDVNTISTTLLWSCGTGQLSSVTASGPRACHNIASGRSRQNTDCHRKFEPYLTVIFRHCVRRDPNNKIRLRSPIYSPAMLIKCLRYRHESSSYHARKEVPLQSVKKIFSASILFKSKIGLHFGPGIVLFSTSIFFNTTCIVHRVSTKKLRSRKPNWFYILSQLFSHVFFFISIILWNHGYIILS